MSSKRYPQLVSSEEFLLNAPRKVVYVETVVETGATIPTLKIKWTSSNANPCYSMPESMSSLANENFCIVKVLSLYDMNKWRYSYEVFTEEQMYRDIFGDLSPEEVTLIFNIWKMAWCVTNLYGDRPLECKDLRLKRGVSS